MKATCKALAFALVLAPTASFATKVPLPIEGATMNFNVQIQPQFLVNEAGSPNGTTNSLDLLVRRTRILVNGDLGPNFSYLLQVDNANFGKYGNFTPRAVIQDAWAAWAPTGISGGTVVYIEAGLLLLPISHQALESTTNYVTADGQNDAYRFPGSALPANRDTGIQIRGWAGNKKVGFRGGVYEGYTPAAATLGGSPANLNSTTGVANCAPATKGSCVAPKRNPMIRAFLNISLVGAEEGGWLYGAYKWAKDPTVSIGVVGNYQSLAIRNAFGSLTDLKVFGAHAYLNLPMTEAAELVAEVNGYLNGNGTGSGNSGIGISAAAGYRFGMIAPYVAYDYFSSYDCDSRLSAAQITTCVGKAGTLGTAHSADSRNLKAGLNFFFNKNLNHVNLEVQVNHGLSQYGPQSINAANAAYAPLALDPAVAGGPRRPLSALLSLAQPAYKSLLLHWNYVF